MPPGARLARAFPGKEKKSPSLEMRTGKPWLARFGRPLARATLMGGRHFGDGLRSSLFRRRPRALAGERGGDNRSGFPQRIARSSG